MKLLMASARVLGGGIIQYWLKICHVKKQHSAEGEKAFAAPTFLKKKKSTNPKIPLAIKFQKCKMQRKKKMENFVFKSNRLD